MGCNRTGYQTGYFPWDSHGRHTFHGQGVFHVLEQVVVIDHTTKDIKSHRKKFYIAEVLQYSVTCVLVYVMSRLKAFRDQCFISGFSRDFHGVGWDRKVCPMHKHGNQYLTIEL